MTNKSVDEMSLSELVLAFKEEVDFVKDNLPNKLKVSWLNSISEDTSLEKLRTISGYLIALKDCNINIGDLKLILEYIIIEREDN